MSKTVLPHYFETLPAVKQLDEGYAAIHGWQFEAGALSLIEEGDVYNVFVQTPYPSRGDAYADGDLCQQFVNALEAGNDVAVARLMGPFYDRIVSIPADHLDETDFERCATRLSERRNLFAIDINTDAQRKWYTRSTGFNRRD